MIKKARHAFGAKDRIDGALQSGAIDNFDTLFLDNGEMGWIDENNNVIISSPRTQTDITVNGVTGLGIEDGETIPLGKTLDEIVRLLVQRAVPAEYVKPTVSLKNNGGQNAGNVEAGTSVRLSLRADFTQNDAGDLTAFEIRKNGSTAISGATSPLLYSESSLLVEDEAISFAAFADYAAAPVKTNNLGDESVENWFDAGSVDTSAYIIQGRRNMFYGTGAGDIPEITSAFVRGLSGKKLAPANGTSVTINVAIGQQYVAFAYPATLRDVSTVMYVEANDSGMASSFTKHTADVADARGGSNGLMAYKVYTYKMAVPAAAPMTFKVTI